MEQLTSANETIEKNEQIGKANAALSRGFETNLFSCMGDCQCCLFTCFCPCIVAGFNAARAADRSCTPLDACCSVPYSTRQLMRAKYGMGYGELADACSFTCCLPCFIIQNTKELAKKKGDSPVYFNMDQVEFNVMGRD